MSGINLHAIVRGAITSVHPDTAVVLYRSTGFSINESGEETGLYAPGEPLAAQIQSEGASTLFHAERVGQEEIVRKFYLFASPGNAERPAGIIRPLSRGGDMIRIAEDAPWFPGTWWLVDGVIEDFTRAGWISVRAILQENPPDFSESASDSEPDSDSE